MPTCPHGYTFFSEMYQPKKSSLRNEKLRVNRASETEEQRKERLRIEDKTGK